MAGGAGDYLVDGVHYSLASTALAQLAADEDGTATTAPQYVTLSIDVTESATVTLPTQAEVLSTMVNPIIIRSANAASPKTVTTSANAALFTTPSASIPKIEFRDLILTGKSTDYDIVSLYAGTITNNYDLTFRRCVMSNTRAVMNGRYYCGFELIECSATVAIGVRTGSGIYAGRIAIIRSKIVAPVVSLNYFESGIYIEASALYLGTAIYDATAIGANVAMPPPLTMLNSTVKFSSPGYIYISSEGSSSSGSGLAGFWPLIRGSIIDNAKGLYNRQIGATLSSRFETEQNRIGNNVWSNIQSSGNNFINSSIPVATFSAYQALGYEVGSVNTNLSFVSTDITSNNFLKPTTVTPIPNVGCYSGIEGNAKTNWLVDAGAHQQTAVAYDASKILTTATPAGTYVPDFPSTDSVLTTDTVDHVAGNYAAPSVADVRPVTFGTGQTGTLANLAATDAAYLALEATRNYSTIDENDLVDGKTVTIGGTTITGVFTCTTTALATPSITWTRVDATHATVTVAGATAGTINRVYMGSAGGATLSLVATINGNGSSTIELVPGNYWSQVISAME